MTRFLLIAILVYFAMTWIAGGPADLAVIINFGANFGPLVAAGEIWRLVVSIFMHANVLHLVLNCLALYFLGRNVEAFYGPWRFLFLFLLSGLVGSVASASLSRAISLGASGGIFGLLGASIVFAFRFRGILPPRVTKIMGTALLPWVALNIVLGVVVPRVDMNAHVGGFLAGALIPLFVAPRSLLLARGRDQPQVNRLMASACLSLLLVSFVAAGENIFRMRGLDGPILDPRVITAVGEIEREEALRAVNEELAERPESIQALMVRGQLHTLAGRWPEAIADYRRLLELDPDAASALNNLAWILLEEAPRDLRDREEAGRLAVRALELAPEDPYVQGTWGTVLLRRGEYQEAATYLRRALDAERPDVADATDRYLLATALARWGFAEEAAAALERAVRTDPGSAYREEAESAVRDVRIQADPAP